MKPNSGCLLCGHDLLFVHGHGQCNNRRCVYEGVNQSPCCQPDTDGLSDAQNGTQGAPQRLSGTGGHRDKGGAQNGR